MRIVPLALIGVVSLSSLFFVACGPELADDEPVAGYGGRGGSGGKAGSGGAGQGGGAGAPQAGTGGAPQGGSAGAPQAGTGGAPQGGSGGAPQGEAGGAGGGASGAGGGGGACGGVGGAGGASGKQVEFCNVQFPKSLCTKAGEAPPLLFGQVFAAGVTDATGTPAPGLSVEVGVGPSGSDPRTAGCDWSFFPATPNPGFNFAENNDEFQGALPTKAGAGTFSYVFRVSLNGGDFKYCDADDAGDFSPASAAPWSVVDGTCPVP